jgi:hypothetical protein
MPQNLKKKKLWSTLKKSPLFVGSEGRFTVDESVDRVGKRRGLPSEKC